MADRDFKTLLEDDYYTFLNLPRNASPEQISSSYKKLSRIYHPDKHLDTNRKQQAEVLFNRTKTAYEVLSDPNKRAIYDTVGVSGLSIDGWEVSTRKRSSMEIRKEYEHLTRLQENQKLQQSTTPRGNVTININATEIFSPYGDTEFDKFEITSINMLQSFETIFSSKDIITMHTSLHSSNGIGNGCFVISDRRLVNKGWFEIDIGAGNGPVFGIKGSRHVTKYFSLSGETSLKFKENNFIPSFAKTLAVRLDKHTVGYLTCSCSSQYTMSTSIESNTEKQSWNSSVVLGVPYSFLSVIYSRKLIEHQLKLKLAVKVGTFGFFVEYGAEKKVSNYSSIAAAVSIGTPTGVVLKLKITRSSQTYSFPIHLSEDILPEAVFYATFAPIFTWILVKHFYIDPRNHEKEKIDAQNKNRVLQKKVESIKYEALAAVDLMRPTYEKIVLDETNQDGLIIIKALYGAFDDYIQSRTINVTIPLQCLVKNGTLTLYKSSKSNLPGFYDPCVGECKFLRIEYRFKSKIQQIEINDTDAISLPL